MKRNDRKTLNKIALLIMLPAVALHELTHAAVGALAGGDIVEISLVPPRVVIEYEAGTSTWKIRAANLSPTVVGVVVSIPLALFTAGQPLPIAAYLMGSWMVYTIPISAQDRNPLKHSDPA